MRKVIIVKDLNYAASKTSATNGSATLSIDLAVGAIGVFGISNTSANNKDKMSLVTNGGSDAAGKVPDAAFDGPSIHIAVGTAQGNQWSGALEPAGKITVNAQGYSVAVQQVVDIAITSDATIAKNDESQIRISDQENLDQGGSIATEHVNFNIATVDSESDYSIASKHVVDINVYPKKWMSAEISSDTAGAAFANTATVAAVKDATSLTTSAAHGVGVGDYVRLGTDTYKAITGTATTTLVLDNPYRGATATIANASTKDLGTTPGNIGVNLTSLVLGRNYQVSVDGVIVQSTITYTTNGTFGQGHSDLVKDMENEARGYKGSTSAYTDRMLPLEDLKTIDGETYDLYTFNIKNPNQENTGGTARTAHDLFTELVVAFPDSPSNDGQSDFEAILGEVLFGASGIGGIA